MCLWRCVICDVKFGWRRCEFRSESRLGERVGRILSDVDVYAQGSRLPAMVCLNVHTPPRRGGLSLSVAAFGDVG